ncbi:MAG: ethanolamine ammonia-lyase subunit EutC [Clostridiales bacterium]|nr:ethanolamine ammonia-lyase subunit EutC [Clostridiales bacterium]MDY3747326.1 ethanolamine ammonia-lyase subunit EutC [Lachnospiraceae bacterium]
MAVDEKLVNDIVRAVIEQLKLAGVSVKDTEPEVFDTESSMLMTDITSRECKSVPLLKNPKDPEALKRMMRLTTARIGVGSAGARLKTQTLLTLRADHALARDAVIMDVDQKVLENLNLFTVQTCCKDKNEYLTRPDLGRKLSIEGAAAVRERCVKRPDVQLIVADGLSSTAINANIMNVLPMLNDGLTAAGLKIGTPFFVRFGRVAVEDQIAELVGAKVVCIFVGERPGLGSAESMSAYLVYNARVGMPEARRTVVSNIHKDGITAVEAGAYLTDLIQKILSAKASGVELQN